MHMCNIQLHYLIISQNENFKKEENPPIKKKKKNPPKTPPKTQPPQKKPKTHHKRQKQNKK